LEHFDQYFNEKVVPELGYLETLRRSLLFKGRLIQFIIVGMFVIFAISGGINSRGSGSYSHGGWITMIAVSLLISSMVFLTGPQLFLRGRERNSYRARFKGSVMLPLINILDPNCDYHPCFKTSERQIDKMLLFPQEMTDIIESDGIIGAFKSMDYRLSKLELRKSIARVFNGIHITLHQSHSYEVPTLLLGKGRHPERKGFKLQWENETFKIYTQHAAFKPDPFFERCREVFEQYKPAAATAIHASFIGTSVFIIIEAPKARWEVGYRKLARQQQYIYRDLQLLNDVYNILHMLDEEK
jgi:hypothetical protein